MKRNFTAETSLLEALESIVPGSSKNNLRAILKQGRATLNGRIVKDAGRSILPGDELEIWSKKTPIKDELYALFEDDQLIVVDKPVGLLSVAANYEPAANVHSFLKQHVSPHRVFVVHRLDREVSGLLIFAFTYKALEDLKQQLESRKIQRSYFAIVEGEVKEESGVWRSFLREDEHYHVKSSKSADKGVEAVTHYKVIKRLSRKTLLEIRLETGRKNQIRVHAADGGHPIIGDKKYGAKTNPVHRLCLHAASLRFSHPISGKILDFKTPLPEEFFQCLEKN